MTRALYRDTLSHLSPSILDETLHTFLYTQWAWECLRYFIDIDFLIKDFRSKQLRERTNER